MLEIHCCRLQIREGQLADERVSELASGAREEMMFQGTVIGSLALLNLTSTPNDCD